MHQTGPIPPGAWFGNKTTSYTTGPICAVMYDILTADVKDVGTQRKLTLIFSFPVKENERQIYAFWVKDTS
jgi:hypothetical protein